MDEHGEVNNVKTKEYADHSGHGIRWRYKHPHPILFWWTTSSEPTDRQKLSVVDYLKNYYNVDIKRHHYGFSSLNQNTRFALHSPLKKDPLDYKYGVDEDREISDIHVIDKFMNEFIENLDDKILFINNE